MNLTVGCRLYRKEPCSVQMKYSRRTRRRRRRRRKFKNRKSACTCELRHYERESRLFLLLLIKVNIKHFFFSPSILWQLLCSYFHRNVQYTLLQFKIERSDLTSSFYFVTKVSIHFFREVFSCSAPATFFIISEVSHFLFSLQRTTTFLEGQNNNT